MTLKRSAVQSSSGSQRPILPKACVVFQSASRAVVVDNRTHWLYLNETYSPMVRTTLLSGRVLLDENLSCCLTISSYFGDVVSSPFGTMCTTL